MSRISEATWLAVQIRGNLPCVLEADQWGRLLAAPLSILEEFQAVVEEVRRAGRYEAAAGAKLCSHRHRSRTTC